MRKLVLRPDADGYQSTDGNEVIGAQLDGGGGRYRRDKIGAPKRVNVQWTMNRAQYQYWRSFYNTATGKGALRFLCDLLSEDGAGPVEHICQIIPGSVTLPTQRGLTYVQQAQLEVIPLPVDEETDNQVIAIYEEDGDQGEAMLLALAQFVNQRAPDELPG